MKAFVIKHNVTGEYYRYYYGRGYSHGTTEHAKNLSVGYLIEDEKDARNDLSQMRRELTKNQQFVSSPHHANCGKPHPDNDLLQIYTIEVAVE